MSTARESIYEMIDAEREYQENTFGTIPTSESTILLLEEYALRARQNWTAGANQREISEYLREIAGIAVRGLEIGGCWYRTAAQTANEPTAGGVPLSV